MSLDVDIRPASAQVSTPPDTPIPPNLVPVLRMPDLPLYPCGTFAPGLVHDPCQHSMTKVLCCSCAGCTADLWWCGQRLGTDSYAWYQAQLMKEAVLPGLTHRYALVVYVLGIVFGLASGLFLAIVQGFLLVMLLGSVALLWGGDILVHQL